MARRVATTEASRAWWAPASQLRWDAGALVLAVGLPLLVLAGRAGPGLTQGELVSALVATPLVLLRRAPLPALAAALVATVVVMALTGDGLVLAATAIVLLYTVSSRFPRRTAWTAGVVTAVTLWASTVALLDQEPLAPGNLGAIAWAAAAVALGEAARGRRAYLAAVEERALLAEQTREEEAGRRVAEERLRIARELHDAVAHRVTIINIQSAAAAQLLPDRPDAAAEALGVVQDSARTVLDEMASMLGLLRGPETPGHPSEPLPTLADLDALAESFRAAGLAVELQRFGRFEGVAESVQLTAYRIAQEGLTNARRHGDGAAVVRVAREPSSLRVAISNGIGPQTDSGGPGGGFGLSGMRERVAAVGGTIRAGRAGDGRFSVDATLPTGRSGSE